jgi:hypothetical protein
VRANRVGIPVVELRLVHQVHVPPDLFGIEGQDHRTALELLANIVRFE